MRTEVSTYTETEKNYKRVTIFKNNKRTTFVYENGKKVTGNKRWSIEEYLNNSLNVKNESKLEIL